MLRMLPYTIRFSAELEGVRRFVRTMEVLRLNTVDASTNNLE